MLDWRKAGTADGHVGTQASALVQRHSTDADMFDSTFATVFGRRKTVALAQRGFKIALS